MLTRVVVIIVILIQFLLTGQTVQGQLNALNQDGAKGDLIFQSGFEPDCQVISFGEVNNKIVGKDRSLSAKNDWVWDLDSANRYQNIYVNYTGGDSTRRFARIIPEPGNPANHVLWYWLGDSWLASENQEKARVQLEFYKIKPGLTEFYQTVRMFLHEDFNTLKSYPDKIKWLTISEFWNNEWWEKAEKYGFRVTLGIGKPVAEKTDLNFILNAENAGQKEVWRGDNPTVKVPVAQWFVMEYYFKEGDKDHGRFWMAITPEGGAREVVFDITNYTHNTSDPAPNGLSGYNPLKMYTSKDVVAYMKDKGKALQIYWDDFKLWKNKRPE